MVFVDHCRWYISAVLLAPLNAPLEKLTLFWLLAGPFRRRRSQLRLAVTSFDPDRQEGVLGDEAEPVELYR